jgi:hypothetical protein
MKNGDFVYYFLVEKKYELVRASSAIYILLIEIKIFQED